LKEKSPGKLAGVSVMLRKTRRIPLSLPAAGEETTEEEGNNLGTDCATTRRRDVVRQQRSHYSTTVTLECFFLGIGLEEEA